MLSALSVPQLDHTVTVLQATLGFPGFLCGSCQPLAGVGSKAHPSDPAGHHWPVVPPAVQRKAKGSQLGQEEQNTMPLQAEKLVSQS